MSDRPSQLLQMSGPPPPPSSYYVLQHLPFLLRESDNYNSSRAVPAHLSCKCLDHRRHRPLTYCRISFSFFLSSRESQPYSLPTVRAGHLSRPRKVGYYCIRRCISHPPGPIFLARYLHSWNSAGVKKSRRWKHLAESFPKMYRIRFCNHLGCRAIELGKPPHGGVIYTVLYGSVLPFGTHHVS